MRDNDQPENRRYTDIPAFDRMKMARLRTELMCQELNLTNKQKSRVQKLNLAYSSEIYREIINSSLKTPTMKKRLCEITQKWENSLKKILDTDEWNRWVQIKLQLVGRKETRKQEYIIP